MSIFTESRTYTLWSASLLHIYACKHFSTISVLNLWSSYSNLLGDSPIPSPNQVRFCYLFQVFYFSAYNVRVSLFRVWSWFWFQIVISDLNVNIHWRTCSVSAVSIRILSNCWFPWRCTADNISGQKVM